MADERADVRYYRACKRLVALALKTGDGQNVMDVKTLMDTTSDLAHRAGIEDPAISGKRHVDE